MALCAQGADSRAGFGNADKQGGSALMTQSVHIRAVDGERGGPGRSAAPGTAAVAIGSDCVPEVGSRAVVIRSRLQTRHTPPGVQAEAL